jgi:FkbM family methyltransferase
MDNQIVCYKGTFWPKYEHNLLITENEAHSYSTASQLMDTQFALAPEQSSLFADRHDVMIQAGGNAGFYVEKYARLFKTVYTFEPLPLLFYCLNLNVKTDNVFKFNCCLGKTNELVSMVDNTLMPGLGNGGSHVDTNPNTIKNTPQLRIDDLNLQICDLIQLDMEGYELNGLLGGIETIKRCKPTIILEDPTVWASRFNSSQNQIEELLSNLNYIFVGTVPCNNDYVYKYKNINDN